MFSSSTRFLVVFVATLLLLGTLGSVASASPRAVDVVTVDPNGTPEQSSPREEVSIMAAQVYVNVPCDEEWRTHYGSNWQYQAYCAIEDADDALYSTFSINLNVSTYQQWNSNNSQNDIVKLLDEAKSEHGLNGKDMMIAFTGQVSNTGAGYILSPYAIVAKSWAEKQICQHEVSHTYGARHNTCQGGSCVIADCVAHFGKWCSTCYTNIYNNRNKY